MLFGCAYGLLEENVGLGHEEGRAGWLVGLLGASVGLKGYYEKIEEDVLFLLVGEKVGFLF